MKSGIGIIKSGLDVKNGAFEDVTSAAKLTLCAMRNEMKDLVKNPIGIIALFISMIYGFANLLLGTTASHLTTEERYPIIIFIVLFPIIVLGVFYFLVSKHHGKLYAPGDYKDDKSFLRTLSQEEREIKIENEVEEALPPTDSIQHQSDPHSSAQPMAPSQDHHKIKEEFMLVENLVVSKFEKELKLRAEKDVTVGNTGVIFDAVFNTEDSLTFLEIKNLRNPMLGSSMLDRILYNAVVTDNYLGSKVKLIIAIVYSFPDEDLAKVERMWRKRIKNCPVPTELRFIPREELIA